MQIMLFVVVFAAVVTPIPKPTTAPTSRPSAAELQLEVTSRQAAEKAAELAALTTLRASPGYKGIKAKADAFAVTLETARRTGSPQEKLEASHNFVVTNQEVRTMEARSIAQDVRVLATKKKVEEAMATVEADTKRRKDEADEEAFRVLNDPINRAIRDGKIVVGMTEKQAGLAFQNRKEKNIRSGGGSRSVRGGEVGIDVAGNVALGRFSVGPAPSQAQEVVRDSVNEYGDHREIVFCRYQHYADADEVLLDRITVIITRGKVVGFEGQ